MYKWMSRLISQTVSSLFPTVAACNCSTLWIFRSCWTNLVNIECHWRRLKNLIVIFHCCKGRLFVGEVLSEAKYYWPLRKVRKSFIYGGQTLLEITGRCCQTMRYICHLKKKKRMIKTVMRQSSDLVIFFFSTNFFIFLQLYFCSLSGLTFPISLVSFVVWLLLQVRMTPLKVNWNKWQKT